MNRPHAWLGCVAWAALAFLLASCASQEPMYQDQIDELLFELAVMNPETSGDVFDFAARHSCQLNLKLPNLGNEIEKALEESGPWYEKLLLVHLLAQSGNPRGFADMIEMVEDDETSPKMREGLFYGGMKYLGFTERDAPVPISGWETDLTMWEEALDRIEEVGLMNWRRGVIRELVLSGKPGSGDDALAVAAWLSYTLEPGAVPFLVDLLGKGSPKCDLAVLTIIEHLLIRKFLPEDGEEEGGLKAGLDAFWAWYETNAPLPPERWMTDVFNEAGYGIDGFYKQHDIQKLVGGLTDGSESWVLVRGHTLAALNTICGFTVDRGIIFMKEDERLKVAEAFLQWYEDLGERLRVD